MIRVQAGHLTLDPFTAGPAPARELYAVRNHPTVRPFMADPALIPYRAHLAWTRAHLVGSPALHLWLVRPAPGVRAIGFTQLKIAGDTAEIGVMFREPETHRLPAALTTAITLHLAYTVLECAYTTSYVIPTHRHAIDFNLAWGASIVDSDKPPMVLLKMHRDACFANANFRRIMTRLGKRLVITTT
jgi:hypothetical protein